MDSVFHLQWNSSDVWMHVIVYVFTFYSWILRLKDFAETIWVRLWEILFAIMVKKPQNTLVDMWKMSLWWGEAGALKSLCSSLLIRSVNLIKWFTLTSHRHESEAIHLWSQVCAIIILVVGRCGLNPVPVRSPLLPAPGDHIPHACHWVKCINSFIARIGNSTSPSSRQLFYWLLSISDFLKGLIFFLSMA